VTEEQSVGIIGYGEVGRSLARAFVTAGFLVIAYDAVWPERAADPDPGVTAAADNAEVAASCRVLFVCTAASAIERVAAQLAGHLADDALVIDLASATAESKIRARDLLGPAADAYLDIALSSPPLHDGLGARMYASGPRSAELIAWAGDHGMDVRYLGDRVGQATQLKILRATLTKGLEAILLESLSTALLYDVDPETVLRTVESAFDDRPFQRFCEYLVSTGVVHDHRRAIEIGEAAQMAEAAGIPADMARAGQRVLERAAGLHRAGDLQDFRSALETYARAAGPATAHADRALAVGRLHPGDTSTTTA
jgi:3-hydroxyisobutyrate dehydrogenase-like beta-hydroxyacid dehydrogenase